MRQMTKKKTLRVQIARRLNKNGSYAFSLRWRDDSKPTGWAHEQIFTTEPHVGARRLARRWEPEAADRRYEKEQTLNRNPHDDPTIGSVKLADAIEGYCAEMLLKRSTHTTKRIARLLPNFREFMAAEFSIDEAGLVQGLHVRAWRQHRLDAGCAAATCNMETSTLSAFFRWMLDRDVPWVGDNPARIRKLHVDRKRVELLVRTAPDLWGLLRRMRDDADHAFNCHGGPWRVNLVLLAACTGLRIGELRMLEPGHWDRERKILSVPDFGTGENKRHRRVSCQSICRLR